MRRCVILQALNRLTHATAPARPASLHRHWRCQHGLKWLTQMSELNCYPNWLDHTELKHVYTCCEPTLDTPVGVSSLFESHCGGGESKEWMTSCNYQTSCFQKGPRKLLPSAFVGYPLFRHLVLNWVKFVSSLSILYFKHSMPILKVWARFSHSCSLSSQLLEISVVHAGIVLVTKQHSINTY